MEKTDKETQDFMNVDSFSQLPFIRPAPAREKPIRLFGINFGHQASEEAADSAEARREDVKEGLGAAAVAAAASEESSRKFECHYCCRNFPTSQALGGHQNAHKRERQHAKRAHLQSALAHEAASAHLFLNYHRSPSAAFKISARGSGGGGGGSGGGGYDVPPHYSPWTHHAAAARSFGSAAAGSYSQPINGNPLPGLWRIPVLHQTQGFNHDRSFSASAAPLPLFAIDDVKPPGGASAVRRVYETAASDHVSLDLHL